MPAIEVDEPRGMPNQMSCLVCTRSSMEGNQPAKQESSHLRIGLVTLGVAGLYVAGVLLLGWPTPCLLMPLALLSLLFGAVVVIAGLILKANRERPRLWKHVAVLLADIAMLYLLSLGPGNYFALLDLRSRVAVALTGGQDELQAWAVGLLAEPREGMIENGAGWRVPKEHWSKQVCRLRPGSITIRPVFKDNQQGVSLNYGGGFFHWSVVVGPPGSEPSPKLEDPNSLDSWIRWSDGIYDWQQG